jgi:DNA-binding SARP family transcriptional activator
VAAKRLREALALVRGRPLADLALEQWAAPEVDHLEERILAAKESRIAADLELGQHAQVVPELQDLVERHPYREHLLELLMLALYRCGRQADALKVYRRTAARNRRELALEPSRPLQQLEALILKQDPALDRPPVQPERRRLRARRRSWKLIAAGAATVVASVAAAAGVAFTRDGRASLASLPAGVAIISAKDARWSRTSRRRRSPSPWKW